MTSRPRYLAPVALAAAIALIVGLLWLVTSSGPGSSPSPSESASAPAASASSGSPSAIASSTAAGSLSPSPTVAPSPSPTSAQSPSATVAPSSSAAACAVTPQDGLLPTDRVVSVTVSTSPTMDVVTFVFDAGSLTPAGPPRGTLDVAKPPFSYASSGKPIDLQGQHALQVRMSNMSLYNDVGDAMFTGNPNIIANLPAVKQVVMYDASEGIAGWYIGYDGNGCVTLVRDGNDITVTIAHS